MSKIGIFLPKIDGIGGVERIAYILARDLGVGIYTSWSRDDLDQYFPDIYRHIINISKKDTEPNLLSLLLNFKSAPNAIDLLIYLYPRSIYLSAIRTDIPYLYYLGGIPHHFYVTAHEHKKYLNKIYLRHYVDKVVWKQFTKRLDNRRVIANSRMIANVYRNITGSMPKDVIYPPVDTNQYKFRPSEGFYLSVSRFETYKRIDWQIEAFRGINEKLVIIGNGPLYGKYSKFIETHKIKNIILLNTLPQDELVRYYSQCKAFIFTSYKEHFGMTPLEAMASGKPVLSVREGGPLEYLEDGVNGFYFENVHELSQKITSLSEDELDSMRQNCLNTAKRFDTSVFIRKFGTLLKDYM